jgi:hypothetical protein
MPNLYFDTEFIEGTQTKKNIFGFKSGETQPTIDLISIGIVSDDGREYYSVSSEFNLFEAWNRWQPSDKPKMADNEQRIYWIRENVLRPIFEEFYPAKHGNLHLYPEFNLENMLDVILAVGKSRKQIAFEVFQFALGVDFSKTGIDQTLSAASTGHYAPIENRPIFYAYFADYDWVALCWLFGKMDDKPKDFPYYCRDLQQSCDEKWEEIQAHKQKKLAFLKKGILDLKSHPNYPKKTDEHHALADARWNKELHHFLKTV